MLFGPAGKEITRIYLAAQTLKVLLGPANPTLITSNVLSNTWQHVRLGIDLTTSRMDVWVNGIQVVTAGATYNTESSITSIVYGQWGVGGSFTQAETYIDNLLCQAASAPGVVPDADLDGTARPLDGNADGTPVVDVGSYEYLRGRMDIDDAKAQGDSAPVGISGPVSTAVFGDRFYIESLDGVSGIGVLGSVSSTGKRITVEGTTTTIDGERMVLPSLVREGSDALVPRAPRMNIKVLGGAAFGSQAGVTDGFGLNNVGLLVSVFGWVTEIEPVTPPAQPSWFRIEDTPGFSVKCLVPPGVTIDPGWSGVLVRGISSCETVGPDLNRLLRVRTADDITPIRP